MGESVGLGNDFLLEAMLEMKWCEKWDICHSHSKRSKYTEKNNTQVNSWFSFGSFCVKCATSDFASSTQKWCSFQFNFRTGSTGYFLGTGLMNDLLSSLKSLVMGWMYVSEDGLGKSSERVWDSDKGNILKHRIRNVLFYLSQYNNSLLTVGVCLDCEGAAFLQVL